VASCCGDFDGRAAAHFSETIADRDLAAYRRKGPGRTTRLLIDELVRGGASAGSLLDIGAGVGALTFELFDAGVTRAIMVDASPAYISAASKETARRGLSPAVRIVQGDFLTVANEIPAATIVTLDRVICCYPEYAELLDQSLRRAERFIGLSYPHDRWYVRAWNRVDNAKRRLKRSAFRTFIHRSIDVEQMIGAHGFRCVGTRSTWTWTIRVYAR
jgi:SAM-dependent methyltransferase